MHAEAMTFHKEAKKLMQRKFKLTTSVLHDRSANATLFRVYKLRSNTVLKLFIFCFKRMLKFLFSKSMRQFVVQLNLISFLQRLFL